MNFSRVLAIGAHPDDIEYSCLGLLLKLKKSGAQVDLFIASYGGKFDSTSGIARVIEAENSTGEFGFSLFVCKDQEFDYFKIESKIREILVSRRIDCVLVHAPDDSHQDHRLIHDVTITALRRLNCSVIKYRSPSTLTTFQFNLLVNITELFDLKFSVLSKHESQMQKPFMSREALKAFHTIYNLGDDSPSLYEQFYIEKMFYKCL